MSERLSLSSLNWVEFPLSDGEKPRPLLDLPAFLATASGAGFTKVGLDLSTVDGWDPLVVADRLAVRGLHCTDVGILRLGDPGCEPDRDRLADLARRVGAQVCAAVFTGPVTVESLTQLRRGAAVLTRAGCRMALEFGTHSAVTELRDAAEICALVGWDRCGILLDSYHFFRAGARWDELAKLGPDGIAMVQVADGRVPIATRPAVDARRLRLPAGHGDFDVVGLLDRLDTMGYTGIVSPEVLSEDLVAMPAGAAAALLRSTTAAVSGSWRKSEQH